MTLTYVTRLFRRDGAKFSDDLVHEKLEVQHGKVGTLHSPMLHYTYDSIEQLLEKTNRYSTDSAVRREANGAVYGRQLVMECGRFSALMCYGGDFLMGGKVFYWQLRTRKWRFTVT